MDEIACYTWVKSDVRKIATGWTGIATIAARAGAAMVLPAMHMQGTYEVAAHSTSSTRLSNTCIMVVSTSFRRASIASPCIAVPWATSAAISRDRDRNKPSSTAAAARVCGSQNIDNNVNVVVYSTKTSRTMWSCTARTADARHTSVAISRIGIQTRAAHCGSSGSCPGQSMH